MKTCARILALTLILSMGLAVLPILAPSNTTAASAEGAANHIAIKGFAFSPAVLTIKVGDTVTWENFDGASHTVKAISGGESFSSGTLKQGSTFSYAFKKAGSFDYICEFHSSMKGTIVVTEAGAAPAPMANMMPAEQKVSIQGFAFAPANLTIPAGTTVTWENLDQASHTVTSTSKDEPFQSGTLQKGGKFSHAFNTAGTFEYVCEFHSGMKGTITVTAAIAEIPQANQVVIQNFAFNPQVLTVTVGSAVTWTNQDSVGHTATSTTTEEPFGSGTLLTGQSFSYRFNKPGNFDYICEVHPSMTGTIVVAASAGPAQPTATTSGQ